MILCLLLNILILKHENGVHLYRCKNTKVLLKTQWIFVILDSLFVTRNFRVHTRVSKCWRGSCSEKPLEPLLFILTHRSQTIQMLSHV